MTELVRLLNSGVVRSKANRMLVYWAEVDSIRVPLTLKSAERLIRDETIIGRHAGRYLTEETALKPSFWYATGDEKCWTGSVAPFADATWDDWTRSEFAQISYRFTDGGDIVYCIRAYGVQFLKSDIEMLFPSSGSDPQLKGGRTPTYDWLGAFAAVSGRQLKHDFVPDIYERGAQAKLAAEMAKWFLASSGKEPSENMLKEKARVLLDHWQREDGN